jgi:PKD repeat protein
MVMGLWLVIALLSSWLVLARSAHALNLESYGEVSRFGGFDESGSVLGKFVLPVGFAVDPSDSSTSDGNAVYVLDRTLSQTREGEEGKLAYRLQKLSSTGVVLGSKTLPVESFSTVKREFTEAHPLISLAVDPVEHRVYAMVESVVGLVPVADKLVAWSTVPNGSKELVKASGYPEDPVTGAGLVAEVLQSEPSEDLYAPEGITVDPKTHDVVIEAQNGVAGTTGGPTILQRVITEGSETGKLGGSWVADSTTSPSEEPGDGLFTATDGESFGVDLFTERGAISRLVDVKRDFTKPEPSLISEDKSGGLNKDQAPTLDNEDTVNSRTSHTAGAIRGLALATYTAGTPITQLTNNLYAARYGQWMQTEVLPDSQSRVLPWSEAFGLSTFWTQTIFTNQGIANEGIRLFEADGKVVTTIGGQGTGQPCNIDDSRLALAAGANGSMFALGQFNAENGNSDDEVIEFAPGGAGKCPTPSGEIEVNGTPTLSANVTQGKSVKFSALSVNRAGASPYAFEWYFEGDATPASKTFTPVSKIEAPNYTWPTPEAEHTYGKAGTYEASVRMTGDYGTSVFPVTVTVQPSEPAVAKFSVPGSIVAKQSATFDAKESKATSGSQIVSYHWDFGDGVKENTSATSKSHTFAAAGEYTVKLKVTDESNETAETEQKVTVAASKEVSKEPPKEERKTEEKPPAQTGGAVIQPPGPGPMGLVHLKPLTNAQKLAKALKACKHVKPQKRRVSCEKQAKKKYGAKAKAKKKSVKKK